MISSLKKSSQNLVEDNRIRGNDKNILHNVDSSFWEDKPIFCQYQIDMILDDSPVSVIEKGRQIGFSWTMSFRAVLHAVSGYKDTIVNSYNKDACKNFLKDCGDWAKLFNIIFETISYERVIENQNVNIFELRFNNGKRIIGLPGTPTSFRSFTNCSIIIDEAAYREQPLADYLGAAMATLIHGGSVRIGSTHCGVDSDFNELLESIKTNKSPYKLFKFTFRDAVEQGLYKRICAKKGEVWTQPKQEAWIEEIYDLYGNRASEELDAIPSDYSEGGKIFNNFKYGSTDNYNPWEKISFRYHDLAASKDPDDLLESACFSASVRITYILEEQLLIIDGWDAAKLSPLEGDSRIEELALQDGLSSHQIIEVEPGSTGLKYVAYMQERLGEKGLFNIDGYKPVMDKVKRALPAGNAIQQGTLLIDENLPDREKFTKLLYKFSSKPQPLITDLGDCVSGAYNYCMNYFNEFLA